MLKSVTMCMYVPEAAVIDKAKFAFLTRNLACDGRPHDFSLSKYFVLTND
jgi:hypothetical protein